MKSQPFWCISTSFARGALSALATTVLISPPGRAVQFASGELKGTFDTTLSAGFLYRLHDPDPDFYGTTAAFNGTPGRQNSVNADDGNLNYGKGLASKIVKGSHDLELKFRNSGALVRGYWFHDWESDDTHRTGLSDQAKDRVVRGAELLDLYAKAKFTLGDSMPLDVRIGRQV